MRATCLFIDEMTSGASGANGASDASGPSDVSGANGPTVRHMGTPVGGERKTHRFNSPLDDMEDHTLDGKAQEPPF